MKLLDHPNVQNFREIIEETTRFCIISEYLPGGDIMEYLEEVDHFNEQTAKEFVKYVLRAVNYMHSEGVTHRDIKPENIMLGSDKLPENLKIVDFGESVFSMQDVIKD